MLSALSNTFAVFEGVDNCVMEISIARGFFVTRKTLEYLATGDGNGVLAGSHLYV